MKNSEIIIINVHKHSVANNEDIENSKICGCFHCGQIFSSKEIKEYIDDHNGKTALCPCCGVDSVVGDASGYEIKEDLLNEMKRYWF